MTHSPIITGTIPKTATAPKTPTTTSALKSATTAIKRLAVSPAASQAEPKRSRETDSERKYNKHPDINVIKCVKQAGTTNMSGIKT